MGFENFQQWTLHNLCVQPVPLFDTLTVEEVFLPFKNGRKLTHKLLCLSLWPLCLVLSLSVIGKGLAVSFSSIPGSSIHCQDSPWAFSFLAWLATVLIASLHMWDFQRSQTSSWVFPELTPVCPYLLYGKPRNEHRTADIPYQCQAEGRNHLHQPAGSTLYHSAQKAVDLLCCEGWLLAYIQFGVHEDSLVLLCTAAVQLSATPCHGAWGYFSPGARVDIFFSCTSLGSSCPNPPACKVPLNVSTILWCIKPYSHIIFPADLLRVHHVPSPNPK